MLGYKLGRLIPGLSPAEVASLQGTTSLKAIALNPVFLPFKLGEYAIFRLGLNSPAGVRMVSALIGAASIGIFYLILTRWHTRRIATIGAILMLSSSWFLHTARVATPTILYVFDIVFLLYFAALAYQATARRRTLLLGALVVGTALYTPGMIGLLLVVVIWQIKPIIAFIRKNPIWILLVGVICFLILLAPAAYAIYHDPSFTLKLLGIPEKIVPIEMLKRLGILPWQLFVRGPRDASIWLARLPIMDIFTGTMFAVGIYNYYLRFKLPRTNFLLMLSIVLILLIAILNMPTVAMMPIVFIVVTGGVTLLLQQWQTVFPHNPIARNIGFCVLLAAVLTSAWYQTSSYFVAWSHNSATKVVYQLKLNR